MRMNDGICSQELRILTHVTVFWNYKNHKAFDSKGKKTAHREWLKNGAKTLLTFSAEKTRLAEDLKATILAINYLSNNFEPSDCPRVKADRLLYRFISEKCVTEIGLN